MSPSGLPEGAVAIVGLSGRFPGAPDVRTLWRNLCSGAEGIRRLGRAELLRAGVTEELADDPRFVPVSADLEGIQRFDPDFFQLSPREAAVIDPQQKLLCELAWEACEAAGQVPRRFAGAVGIFVGASRNDWTQRVLRDPRHLAALGAFSLEVATGRDFLATRLAYLLDCEGPCLTVQTACSTSLVAVHLACQSLLEEECDLVLAGGVSIRLPQGTGYLHAEGSVASRDGHCRTFDAAASGTVPGNGGGLVCLRRLEDALADGDPIVAVIRGTAVNNDGARRVGFTAPSVEGQRAVIEEALSVAGLTPAEIGYVEAHGTATPLGDPIEVEALRGAFGAEAPRGGCALGSIKTNLGHLDAAAGVAGLIKAALCVATGRIPPSLHFARPNPALELERSPFRIATELAAWSGPTPRRAGVSSFGIGGTNAHAIVEEPPPRTPVAAAPTELLVLSGTTPTALEQACERLGRRLDEDPDTSLAEVAWTLQTGRTEFPLRVALTAHGTADAARRLQATGHEAFVDTGGVARQVALLFPGQGELPLGAVHALARRDEAFAAELERCSAGLRQHGSDFEGTLRGEQVVERGDTRLEQPLLFAIEVALARRLTGLRIGPGACLGHSLGELVAATVSGVFDLNDALGLVVARGRLMSEAPAGAMLAVQLSATELADALPHGCRLAAELGPRLCVAAGGPSEVDALEDLLRRRRLPHRRVVARHAFHTPAMDTAATRFAELVAGVERESPAVPWISNLTGDWITAERARDPEYWSESMRAPVRLAQGLARLSADGDHVTVELGPSGTFTAGLRQLGAAPPVELLGAGDEPAAFLAALGRLWEGGVHVDWSALDGRTKRRTALPTYPFQRRRSWPDEDDEQPVSLAPAPRVAVRPTPPDARSTLELIWQELLGIEEVHQDDDFFVLGGSSLLAVQLHQWILERMAADVAPAALASTPLFTAQCQLVEEARQAGGTQRLVRLARGPEDPAAPPLVLVHGIDGDVLAFAPLARLLGTRRAVYGLRSPALDREGSWSVEALAEEYASLLGLQGLDRCQLAGYSFGALVVLELARLLEAEGRPADAVLLLDARPVVDEDEAQDEDLLRRAALERAPVGHEAAFQRAVLTHARAAHVHRPAAYARPVQLLLAEEGAGAERAETVRRWSAALKELRVYDVPGDHDTFLSTHSQALAATIVAAEPTDSASCKTTTT